MDRVLVKNQFNNYVKNYNDKEPKIALKIAHTYRVAEISERIAVALGLNEEEVDIAWEIGMLHDIGRFEQVKRYNTFIDSKSVNHAEFGCELLFEEGLIEGFGVADSHMNIIRTAINNHNVYKLPANLTEEELKFCKIIRDADKIDIIRVNYETPMEEVYNTTTYELKNSGITDPVFNAFFENKAIKHSLKSTAVDMLIGHFSLCYELEYDISREILKEQGYLEKLMGFESLNDETNDRLDAIRKHMREYLYG